MYRLLELSPLSARPSFDIFFAIVHPEDRLLAQQRFIETISQREPYDLTHRLQMPDGRIKWVKVCCNTDFDKNGRALRSVGIAQDITNQKLTDDALHLTQQQLRSIIDNMPAMVFMKRANDLRFELFNRAGEELLGYRAEQLIGKNDRDFFSPEQADFFEMQDRRVLESNEAVEIKEEAIRTASGATLTLHTRKVALRDAQGTATHLLGISVDISEHKRSAERINQLAYYDQLTGLPNRTLLLDRLRLALATCHRNNTHGALLFLDLDKFKTLNDTQGHDKGDLLLQQVAERLTSCVRGCDTVARLGGDEFVVMLSDLSINAQDAGCQTEAIGEKLLMALSQPYQFGNFVHRCTASIGVAMFDNQRSDIDVLLKQADLAMYKAKAAGRNSLRFFDPHLETDIQRRAALERDLHDAIHGGHFSLHYQAQMCDGTLTGSEALIRWDHPQRGMVPPAEFIPLAEETGLILPLGAWVLETACRQLAEWSRNPELSRLTIAVNVSAQQFRKPDFVGQVDTVLRATGANPQRLKLELTESLLIEDIDNVIDKMHALKAIGVGFALDDFGTGYSSLYYLKRLPLDQLKIDQSFIRDILDDPNDAAIARTIVALARNLGLMVLAEGVETEAQFDFLSEIDCHAHQGYYFSQPLPARHFEEFALHL
jgi:diguanylate cyclase (GGDEF)-like protein/PAS domain S-box-containing protein